MIWPYNAILVPLALALAPLLLLWALTASRRRRGLAERLSLAPELPAESVWVHAASVGEAEAAAPLIEALLERGIPAFATTLTATGRDRLRARLPGLHVRLAPLDLPWLVSRSLARTRASVLVLIETELWPNLIWGAARAGARPVVVSGRLSDRSFARYRRARPLVASVLRAVWRLGAQSERERERFVALGLPAGRARVTGDLKLDRGPAPRPSDELRRALGPGPLLVAGSTHPGEEEALLEAWRSLRPDVPGLRLVLVPRHPERVRAVLRTAERHGASAGLRSTGAAAREVVVVDSIGELGAIYALAELVFVGGTLRPIGGHNLVEPVQAGKLVVHGPHTENQRGQEHLLRPLGVLRRVESARDLANALRALLAEPGREARCARARAVLDEHRGALGRSLELILEARSRSA